MNAREALIELGATPIPFVCNEDGDTDICHLRDSPYSDGIEIISAALDELEAIKKRAESKMNELSETENKLNNFHSDGSLSEYWEDERKREVIEDKRLIDFIIKGEGK